MWHLSALARNVAAASNSSNFFLTYTTISSFDCRKTWNKHFVRCIHSSSKTLSSVESVWRRVFKKMTTSNQLTNSFLVNAEKKKHETNCNIGLTTGCPGYTKLTWKTESAMWTTFSNQNNCDCVAHMRALGHPHRLHRGKLAVKAISSSWSQASKL